MDRAGLLLLALLTLSLCSQIGSAQQKCNLQMSARHTFGIAIGKIDIEAQRRGDKETLTRKGVRSGDWLELACGDYDIRVVAEGHSANVFKISLISPHTWVPISLELGSLTGPDPPCSLTGIVTVNANGRRPYWVKLTELYSNIVLHAATDSEGHFKISNLRASRYHLLVFDDDKIVDHRIIEVRGDEVIKIIVR